MMEPMTNPKNDPRNPDLLLDFEEVEFTRGGKTLVGPITWQVELDERWVILGPNGAGKTTLIRMAAAEEFPSKGALWIMGERIGKTDMRDLRAMIGVSSSALGNRIPTNEKVLDLGRVRHLGAVARRIRQMGSRSRH